MFAIALPAMTANLTTPLLGVVSMAVIGRLGDATLLGGVALATTAFNFTFWMFGFLRMGTVGFTAQAIGAGDATETRAVFGRAALIAVILGALLISLQWPLASLLFYLLGGSEAVTSAAKLYFKIRVWSAPFMLTNYVVIGWLVGNARAGRALAIQVVINLVNIAVTSLLVLVFDFGIAGAAIAPVVAEATGLVLGLSIVLRLAGGSLSVPRTILLQRDRFVRLMSVNRDIMIRTAALLLASMLFTGFGARSGDDVLAGNAVLYLFVHISSSFLDGLAPAASQLSGQAVGARDREAFVRTTQLVLGWAAVFALFLAIVISLGGGLLIDFITTSPDVRAAARGTLWLTAMAPLCGVMAYAFDGIFIGATWARDMRSLMIAAFVVYLSALWLLQPFGNYGLWGAHLTFLFIRGVFQAARYPSLLRATFGEKTNTSPTEAKPQP